MTDTVSTYHSTSMNCTIYAGNVGDRGVRHVDAAVTSVQLSLAAVLEVTRARLIARKQVREVGAVRAADERQRDERLVDLHRGRSDREGEEDGGKEGGAECHGVSLLSLARSSEGQMAGRVVFERRTTNAGDEGEHAGLIYIEPAAGVLCRVDARVTRCGYRMDGLAW